VLVCHTSPRAQLNMLAVNVTMAVVSAKHYEINHSWSSWCHLPSFSSIRKYQQLAAQLCRAGTIHLGGPLYQGIICVICLRKARGHASIILHSLCQSCGDAIMTLGINGYPAGLTIPTQWHTETLPAQLDQSRKAFVLARVCHGDKTSVRSSNRCDICTNTMWTPTPFVTVDNVTACHWCIRMGSCHTDAFYRKLTLLGSIGSIYILPEITREILGVFIQLHDLWSNLMIVPYA